jgi:hypothetical protein
MYEIKKEGSWFVIYRNGQWIDMVRSLAAAKRLVKQYQGK